MVFLRLLARVELRALLGALLACALFAAYELVKGPAGFAFLTLVVGMVVGGAMALVYGGPLYAALLYWNRASWPAALILGAAPGAAIYFLLPDERELGIELAIAGLITSLTTHFLTLRYRK